MRCVCNSSPVTTDREDATLSPAGRPAKGIDCAALFAAIPTSYLVVSPRAPHYTIFDANDLHLANVDRTREDIVELPVFDASRRRRTPWMLTVSRGANLR